MPRSRKGPRSPARLIVPLALGFTLGGVITARSATDTIDPPPVNETALAARLFEMTRPEPGERALIVYDPTYYPGITNRLREALHARGVQTYVVVEDSPALIATYLNTSPAGDRREADVIATLRPLFRASDIFYWMPTRGYADDLRWERLVEESRVRSVHFHWLLRFPGARTPEQIETESRAVERRSLEVDFDAHARRQRALGDAMRGQTLRITTPGGTHLTVRVPRDQWFHFGDGDASKARAATARSIRDRQMELPVGMFVLVPDARAVSGTIAAPTVSQSVGGVRDAVFTMERGRVVGVTATEGLDWIVTRMREVGPDGNRIGSILANTHPLTHAHGITIDIGANWENGGRNRAEGMRRMTIRLADATVTAGSRVLIKDGSIAIE